MYIYSLLVVFFWGRGGGSARTPLGAREMFGESILVRAHTYIYTLEHNMGNWGRGGVDEISDVVDVKNKSDLSNLDGIVCCSSKTRRNKRCQIH